MRGEALRHHDKPIAPPEISTSRPGNDLAKGRRSIASEIFGASSVAYGHSLILPVVQCITLALRGFELRGRFLLSCVDDYNGDID